MTLRVAIDPGFGAFKAAISGSDERVTVVPSVVGVGDMDIGLLSVGRLGRQQRVDRPLTVSYNGACYLVGSGVTDYARPIERMDVRRLSDGPELRSLFYATMFRLLGPGDHGDLALLVGLPVEVLQNTELASDTVRTLRRWLLQEGKGRGKTRTHSFTVDGQEVSFQVAAVEVLPQPAGAFFAWGLDASGIWVRAKEDLEVRVGIIDVGFNTTDLFVVQSGRVRARWTGGDTLGMRRAAELLAQALRGEYGVNLSLHEVDDLLRARHPTLMTPEGRQDLTPSVRQALDALGAAVLSMVEQRWANGRDFPYILLAGGGSEILAPFLRQVYAHAHLLPNPITANALGLARYAQRKGVFGTLEDQG